MRNVLENSCGLSTVTGHTSLNDMTPDITYTTKYGLHGRTLNQENNSNSVRVFLYLLNFVNGGRLSDSK